MVGYRVGWGILPEKISQKIRENLTIHQSSFSSISERAAVAALSGKTSKDFSQSRQFLYDWLDEMGLPYQKTGASFYVFVDCFELIKNFTCKDSLELASYLLEKTGVALAPGQAFGDYSDYLRISYCQPVSVLKKALKSLEKEVGMNG
jgi:aspartate aminotransferase